MPGKQNREQVQDLCELGTRRLMEGRVSEAIELYEKSIDVKPTAEGYLFADGRSRFSDDAIEDARKPFNSTPSSATPTTTSAST